MPREPFTSRGISYPMIKITLKLLKAGEDLFAWLTFLCITAQVKLNGSHFRGGVK